jgi:hypothetical protein
VRFFVVDCLEMRFHVGDKLLQQIIVFREQLLSYFDIVRFQLEEMEVNLFSSLLQTPSHIL